MEKSFAKELRRQYCTSRQSVPRIVPGVGWLQEVRYFCEHERVSATREDPSAEYQPPLAPQTVTIAMLGH